jgi:hypothetical protein
MRFPKIDPIFVMAILALATLSICAWRGILNTQVNAEPTPFCAVKVESSVKPKPDDRLILLGKRKALQLCGSMCA